MCRNDNDKPFNAPRICSGSWLYPELALEPLTTTKPPTRVTTHNAMPPTITAHHHHSPSGEAVEQPWSLCRCKVRGTIGSTARYYDPSYRWAIVWSMHPKRQTRTSVSTAGWGVAWFLTQKQTHRQIAPVPARTITREPFLLAVAAVQAAP